MMNYKHLNIWNMAASSLWRYRVKNLSFSVPLTFAVACTFVMTVISDGFLRDIHLVGRTVPDITMQKLVGGRVERISLSVCKRLKAFPEVERVVPRVWGYLPVEVDGQSVAYTLMGVDLDLMPPSKKIKIAIDRGRYLRNGERGAVVVGRIYAEKNGIVPGMVITLKNSFEKEHKFRVVGIFSMGVQIYTADLILTSIEDARNFLNYSPDTATDIAVYTKDVLDPSTFAQKIARDFQGTRVLSRDAVVRVVEQAYGGRGGIFQLVWIMFVVTASIVAWAEGMSVGTQIKREIGILKAIGWSVGDVIEMKMIEGFLISCVAFILGGIVGMGYILLDVPGIKDYFLGWASIYPDFPIPVHINLSSLVMIFCIAVFPLLFAVMIPSWIIGLTEPDTTIRG